MRAFTSTKVKRLFAVFVVSLVTLVGVAVFGVFGTLAALGSPAYAGTPPVFAFFHAAFPYIALFFLDGLLACVLFVWIVASVVRDVSLPRSERLGRVARITVQFSPKAREFGLSKRVEPTMEDRMDELKAKYVADEIDEFEFERRMLRLLDGPGRDGRVGPTRGHNRTEGEFEREF